ncbi:substrate-binding periplasmic protein [Salidesulfovibrio onnuriiensis]|uniref:substrate-binding periplasmic protein n=1 Tax=Salidesulfovibrio onnuriiensis TaxID=2583823 RepID=UPI0011C86DDE|nr:transporter substrate-binding domain-containing protein [Salidesulfovibrio onnuriiensis]
MKKVLRLLFLAILGLLLPVGAALAGSTIMVATDYWPPFRIESEDIRGIDPDILHEVGKRMGVEFVMTRMPWARCLEEMRRGGVDMMSGLAKTPERAEYIQYSDVVYYACAPAFYAREGTKAARVSTYAGLRDFSIGYTRSSAYFEPFDSDKTLHKMAGNNEHQLLRMVSEGRWDMLIGTDCQVDYDLARMVGTENLVKVAYRPEQRVNLYMGFSKRSPFRKRMGEFDAILRDMLANGEISRIASRYLKVSAK